MQAADETFFDGRNEVFSARKKKDDKLCGIGMEAF